LFETDIDPLIKLYPTSIYISSMPAISNNIFYIGYNDGSIKIFHKNFSRPWISLEGFTN